MSQTAIQNLIEIVRNETELHGNTKERIASLLTLLNTEKMDRADVESIISEITNISPLFFDQFGNILAALTAGWTVQFSDEEYIDSLDGRKVIRKVTGYVGGTGALPAALSANIGKYFAKAGGFTTSKADATIYETSELLIKEAKQGNAPTPYDAVAYPDGLFEKYQVKSPLTMPNSWGSAVTQAELDENFVFFDVTNGVVSKFTQPLLRGADGENKIYKWVAKAYTEGQQVITADGWFEVRAGMTASPTDVPGEDSLIWEVISAGSNEVVELVLKYFLENVNYEQITILNTTTGIPSLDGSIVNNTTSYIQQIPIPIGFNKLRFIGYLVQATTPSLYASILAEKSDGTFQVLKQPNLLYTPQIIEEINVDIPIGTDYVIVCWNNYLTSAGSTPEVTISQGEIIEKEDAVKNYVDKKLEVLEYFLEQAPIDDEIEINLSSFQDGVLQNANTVLLDPAGRSVLNVDVEEFNRLIFTGYPAVATTGSLYATVLGIKSNNQIDIIKPSISYNFDGAAQTIVHYEIDLTDYTKISIGWSNHGVAQNVIPNVKFQKTSALASKVDAVKNYIDANIPKDINVFTKKSSITLPEANYNIHITGDLPTDISAARTPTDVILDIKLGERTVISINASMKVQGQASVNWSKKNYSIDFKNGYGEKLVVAFGDRVSSDGYVFKSQFADTSKIAEQVACHIWHGMRTSGDFPENRIDNQPIDVLLSAKEEIVFEEGAKFFAYGFPIYMYHKGNFLGVYILRLKKGRNNYRFVSSNKQHIFLDFDYTLPGNAGTSEMLNFNEFKPHQWELRNPKISGYDAGETITDPVVMTPISNLWVWLSAIYNNTLTNANDHAAVATLTAWIDYYIMAELVYHYDGLDNNILIGSWDGVHFSPLIYDVEGSFGMGSEILNIPGKIVNNGTRGYQFWRRFGTYYSVQIKARYAFLKSSGVLSMSAFQKIVQEQGSKMTSEMQKADHVNWGYLDVVKKSPQQILVFLKNRLAYLDTQFL